MGDGVEIAWAAGFFDGEGHSRNNQGSFQMSLSQKAETDDEPPAVLVRFQNAVGAGNVYRVKMQHGSKNYWRWNVAAEARKVFRNLRPFLSPVKVQQGDAALARADGYVRKKKQLKEFCVRGHRLAETRKFYPCGTSLCIACVAERQREARLARTGLGRPGGI